jgi:AcrR family transcriptional regulator
VQTNGVVHDSVVAAPPTREWLIEVAQQEIYDRGLGGVSMRGIAARANVDASLVRHQFGSKQNLLLQAVHVSANSGDLVAEALRGSAAGVGRRTVQLLLDLCDNPHTAARTLNGLSAPLTGPEAASLSEATFLRPVFRRITAAVSPDHHELRAALVAAQMVALVVGRYLATDPVLAASTSHDLARIIGRSVQRQLTGPLPWAPDEAGPEMEPPAIPIHPPTAST